MSMTCKICRHNDRKGIERALVRGDSLRDIARHFLCSKDAVQRHRLCMSEAYDKALVARQVERGISLQAELTAAIRLVKKIFNACDEWLTDPDDPSRYTLDPRARELVVVYERPIVDGETVRWEKQRVSLDGLLAEVFQAETRSRRNPKLSSKLVSCTRVRGSEMTSSDISKLLLKANENLERLLRLCGDITGEFKQPQVDKRMYEEFVAWFERMCKMINPDISRRVIVECLADMPETTGEFMPFVLAELDGDPYLN